MPMKIHALGTAGAVAASLLAGSTASMHEGAPAEGAAAAPAPHEMPSMHEMHGSMAMATGADILNFALNLECLEAEFYSYAAYGVGLSAERRGGGPEAVGGRKANLSHALQKVAEEIAGDEIAHVDFLRAALGGAAVPCPAIDIGAAFKAAADAAAGTELAPAFDPYADDVSFLLGAFIFEDVGVTAYRGAVEPLTSLVDAGTLSAAAGILAVEAYHAGAIRTLLAGLAAAGIDTPFGPISAVADLISDLRDSVDGADDVDQGLSAADPPASAHGDGMYGEEGPSYGAEMPRKVVHGVNLVPTDANGLAYQRSVDAVLAIVYLGGEGYGGFLPEGVTGFFGPSMDSEGPPEGCPGVCTYRVSVDMSWSPDTHPIDFPMDPAGFVFPFWTVAHDKSFTLFRRGGTASPGMREIAETGAGEIFMEEVMACGDACGDPGAIPCNPMSGVCSGSAEFQVSKYHPYLSTAAMVAPSPDWFTGVDSWELCQGGEWVGSVSRPMPPYDAGTDSGPGFLSPDMPTVPQAPIFSFAHVTPIEASIFYNPNTGAVAPVGHITAELVGCQ